MFGLSKKKEKNEHPEYLKLVEKWDTFLAKMNTRFEESLVNAEEALLDNLVESNYDMVSSMQAWSGIKSQLQSLSDKIEDTFDNTVKPQMLEYKEEWDILDEGQKGIAMGESFYERIDRYQVLLEGKIAQRFYNHAVQFLNEDFKCTQCSAKLEIKKDIFRSHYVSCDYCNTVNTFTPNDKIAQIRWVVDKIVELKCLDERDEKDVAYKALNSLRSPAEGEDKTEIVNAYKKCEDAEKKYWSTYFKERYAFLPEYEETYEHDIEVKMRFFYEDRKRKLGF